MSLIFKRVMWNSYTKRMLVVGLGQHFLELLEFLEFSVINNIPV